MKCITWASSSGWVRNVLLLCLVVAIALCFGTADKASASTRQCTHIKREGWFNYGGGPRCRHASRVFEREVNRISWRPTAVSCRLVRSRRSWWCQAGKHGAQNDPRDPADVAYGWSRGSKARVIYFS